jgi:hypothetical protein
MDPANAAPFIQSTGRVNLIGGRDESDCQQQDGPPPEGQFGMHLFVTHFAKGWFLLSLLGVPTVAAGVCAALSYSNLPKVTGWIVASTVILLACASVGFLLRAYRRHIKIRSPPWWSRKAISSVVEETDDVSTEAVTALIWAAGALCMLLSAFTLFLLPRLGGLGGDALGWATATFYVAGITFYAFHRILRPADRYDPLRTILELEAVEVCMDAVDMAACFSLGVAAAQAGHDALATAALVVTVVWIQGSGLRIAILYLAHVPMRRLYCGLSSRPESRQARANNGTPRDCPRYLLRSGAALRLRALTNGVFVAGEVASLGVRGTFALRDGLGGLSGTDTDLALKNLACIARACAVLGLAWQRGREGREGREGDGRAATVVQRCHPQRLRVYAGFLSFVVLYGALMTRLSTLGLAAGPGGGWHYVMWAHAAVDALVLLFVLGFLGLSLPCSDALGGHDLIFELRWKLPIAMLACVANFALLHVPSLYFELPATHWPTSLTSPVLSTLLFSAAGFVLFADFSTQAILWCHRPSDGRSAELHEPDVKLVSQAAFAEAVMDVLSAIAFFQLDATAWGTPTRVLIVVAISLELFSAALALLFPSICADNNVEPSQRAETLAQTRGLHLLADLVAFGVRVGLLVGYGVSSVLMIKNLYHVLHALVAIERTARCKYPRGHGMPRPNDIMNGFDDFGTAIA